MRLILAAELLLFDVFPALLGYAAGLLLAAIAGWPLLLALVAALLAGVAGEIGLRRRCCRDSQEEWIEGVERDVEAIW